MKVKKVLLDIHIYMSLLCAGYMVIYGLSSISLNHQIPLTQTTVEWQTTIDVPHAGSDAALASLVLERLDLIGKIFHWRTTRPRPEERVFHVGRPARNYEIHLDMGTGRVEVMETRTDVWDTLVGLHGQTGWPNSSWATSWSLYTEFSVWAVMFAVASGSYFWWQRRSQPAAGWWLLGLGSVGSISFMLYMAS